MRAVPILLLLSVAALAARATSATAQPAAPPACTASLDLHVVDDATHEPVNGAFVRIDGGDVGETDDDGHAVLTSLCAGPRALEVERADYQPGQRSIDAGTELSIELHLVALPTETIVVEAEAPDDHGMASSTELSGAALERTRGRGFAETLTDVPGVTMLRSASGMAKPIVRGQYGRRLLMLVDGIRHRAQEWGLDHAPEIDPFVADKLTVVRGAAGVRYGPDAIGGAVLVEPPELLHEPGYAGQVNLIGSTNGFGGAVATRLQAASARWPGLAGQIEGSAKRMAATATPDYPLDNTGVAEWNLGGTAGYRRGNAAYKLSYFHYDAELGVCSCLRIDSRDDFLAQLGRSQPLGVELFRPDASIDRPSQAVSHDLALARGAWTVDDLGTFTGTYAFQYDHRREYDVVRQATTGPQFNFELTTHDVDLAFEHNPIHLSDHWHLRGAAGLVGMAQVHYYNGLPLVPDHTAIGGGAYVIERLVGHTVELEGGLRYDALTRTASIERQDFLRLVRSGQIAADGCGDPNADPATCTSTYHTLSASLGGLWHMTEALSAKLDLSTSSRPPNPDEQYLNGTAPTSPVLGLGKPDLGAETTYAAAGTVSYQGDHVAAEVSGYANRIDDYIQFAPALDANGEPIFDVLIRGTFPRFVTRPVDALFYGLDGGVTVKPIAELDMAASLSMVRGRNRTDDGYLVFVPADRASGTATYTAPTLWGLHDAYASVNGTVVARQDRFDINADLAPPPPGYGLLGAEVGATLPAGDDQVKVSLQGSNLLDTRYRDYTSLLRYFADQPGMQVMLRVSVAFHG